MGYKYEQVHQSVRRDLIFPFFHLHQGTNPRAAARGHWGTESGKCKCGERYGHKGFYNPIRYRIAGVDIGRHRWLYFTAWINNEGEFGTYYKIGGLIFSVIARTDFDKKLKLFGPKFERSRPYG